MSTDHGDVQMPPKAAGESDVRLVVDAIPTQVWRAAADGTVQFVNQPWIEYTGLSLEQSQGGVWSDSNIAHGDDLPGFLDTWQRALATGHPAEVEARLRRFDGAYRWFLIRVAPLRDPRGAIVEWCGTNTDIHDRKQAEALLAGQNRLLEMLGQGLPLASILSRLCDVVEGLFDDSFVSIMLLNPDDNRLWYSAKGSLPQAYTQALDGIEVGPSQGSCGTAAYLNEPVIVPDVTTDPRWLRYRDIAAAFGIRACWSTPIRASEGNVLGTFAILTREAGTPSLQHRQVIAEVTHLASVAIARTRMETALRRSEAYLAEGQRLSRTGSFGWNVASGDLFWSKETFSILGYEPGTRPTLELVFRRVHPDDLPFVQETVTRAARDGGDLDFEHRLRGSDGSVRYLHVRAQAVRNESGALEFIGAVSDVTAAKEADKTIRRNEGELRQIIDTIPQLIAVLSPSGEVLYVNQSVLEFTGLRAEDVKADGFRSWLFHPDDLERLRDERRRRLEEGAPFELEARARGKQPNHRWFLIHYEPFVDEQGQILRWYATGTDIDARKRAEDRIRNENQALREEINRTSMFEEIVGASEALRAVLQQVAQVAPTDSTALITGETGTGKELVARAIHRRSARSARAFVSVNCAAVPASLVVSELFGHERGAFTGALQQRQGRFELADGGTIFLDEVGELPADAQVALLRVLQEREFERLGGSRPIRIDVRVIAATNRDLQAAVAEKTFRADLFYRLNVFPVEVPPLRDRGADIPLLVEYFVHRFAKRAGKSIRGISEGTFDLLQRYPWPGNIRELQNVIERAVIVCDTDLLSVDERWLAKQPKLTMSTMPPLDDELAAHEKARVEAALAESKGRVSGPLGAAARLGIPRSTLESKIRSLKVDKHRFKTNES